MRIRARIDDNQPQIVSALRKVGASVLHMHTLGKGAPDICVAYQGRTYLMEIKDGSKPPSKQKLTPDEEAFHASWQGQIYIVRSSDEALRIINQA